MSRTTGLVRTLLEPLLERLVPGRGGHRATSSTGVLSATAWPPAPPVRRRLVRAHRVPPGLLPLRGADVRPARPYAGAPEGGRPVDQYARRRELEESVRRLNTWSSGGGGRR
ncbi:hypothetical protein ACH4UR_27170 [Streptomyces lydicus]|uniref:hypothetical protein n=1 Tax=Streptomyces lydicus TaxID=47763 RepID=UPI0033D0CAB2